MLFYIVGISNTLHLSSLIIKHLNLMILKHGHSNMQLVHKTMSKNIDFQFFSIFQNLEGKVMHLMNNNVPLFSSNPILHASFLPNNKVMDSLDRLS